MKVFMKWMRKRVKNKLNEERDEWERRKMRMRGTRRERVKHNDEGRKANGRRGRWRMDRGR